MKRRTFTAGLLAAAAAAAPTEHELYMRLAIEAARNNPRAPFGAVIVDRARKQVLASGFNKSSQNPVWHGEIDAINRCAADHPGIDWKRLTLYTTAEPCSMCHSAAIWSGMPLVVYGTSILYPRKLGWGQIDLRAEQVSKAAAFNPVAVVGGVLEKECNALFEASPISKAKG